MKYHLVIKAVRDGGVRRETTFDEVEITALSWNHAVVKATAWIRSLRGDCKKVVVYDTTGTTIDPPHTGTSRTR